MPSTTAESFISGALAQTNADNTGQGVISIYPYNRSVFNTPFFRVPESSHFFLFALLRNAIPSTAERAQELIALNQQIFEQVKAAGGMRYPVDSVTMTQQDWRDHFGPMWETFAMSKRFFDPENLLAVQEYSCATMGCAQLIQMTTASPSLISAPNLRTIPTAPYL